MKVLFQKDYGDFSNYFLASNCEDVDVDNLSDEERFSFITSLQSPVLELTHNHGTENNIEFKHFNGNEDGRQGERMIGDKRICKIY